MDYKDVLEKQIELLLEVQGDLKNRPGYAGSVAILSKQIQSLVETLVDVEKERFLKSS